jgi:hypothetical protein
MAARRRAARGCVIAPFVTEPMRGRLRMVRPAAMRVTLAEPAQRYPRMLAAYDPPNGRLPSKRHLAAASPSPLGDSTRHSGCAPMACAMASGVESDAMPSFALMPGLSAPAGRRRPLRRLADESCWFFSGAGARGSRLLRPLQDAVAPTPRALRCRYE